ncbi:hypothetical protein CHS0354_006124 [Potamilus streckersoni]|uniref:Cullin family profile domain-containing protein n=1 Tax=Potamilus streckersoni TaxID=2493646 RepID=A0AAE0W1A1_9BIVA|nr:hypothetical protein CHS0354_006124 [Potamilus streckersoni]
MKLINIVTKKTDNLENAKYACRSFITAGEVINPVNKMMLYKERFEKQILSKTSTYFRKIAEAANSTNIRDYANTVNENLQCEGDIAHICGLPEKTLLHMQNRCKNQLVVKKLDVLCENYIKEIDNVTQDETCCNMRFMYDVLTCTDAARIILQVLFYKRVQRDVVRLINSAVGYIDFIDGLCNLYAMYNRIIKTMFIDDKVYYRNLQEIIIDEIRKFNHSNEYLCEYLNLIASMRDIDENFLKMLSNGEKIFEFISDADGFKILYENKMLHRLLNTRYNLRAESMIVDKFAKTQTWVWINSIVIKINDVEIIGNSFAEFCSQHFILADNIHINVRPVGLWNVPYIDGFVSIATGYSQIIDEFNKFIIKKHNGIKELHMMHQHGYSELQIGSCEILTIRPFCDVLLCFAERDISVGEIAEKTKMSPYPVMIGVIREMYKASLCVLWYTFIRS